MADVTRVNWKSFALRHLTGRGAGVPLWVFGAEAERAPARYEEELQREGLMTPCTHRHRRFQITEAGKRYLRDSFQTARVLLDAHAAEAADAAGTAEAVDAAGTAEAADAADTKPSTEERGTQ